MIYHHNSIRKKFRIIAAIIYKYEICILLCLIIPTIFEQAAYAQKDSYSKKTAVFGISGNDPAMISIMKETVEYVKQVFYNCGRFLPVENKDLDAAINEAKQKSDIDIYDYCSKSLNLDLYVTLSVYQIGNIFYSDILIMPQKDKYENLKKRIRLSSKITSNIKLKTGREIALMHKNLPVMANIINKIDDNNYLIDAGEWDGIKNKTYRSGKSEIRVLQTGRFESLVKISDTMQINDVLIINEHPDFDKIVNETNSDITRNAINKYSLDSESSQNTEHRMLEGICLVNTGANVCIPGYGSFLSTGYYGFKNPKADVLSSFAAVSLVAAHFVLPELMTGFKINFFPWIRDNDKSREIQNLQKFLWLSLPVTFSASHLDQLSYQYLKSERLPAFFGEKNKMAAFLSFFIPGGGSYYKGDRIAGRVFYFSEMMLAGYGIYNSKQNGKYALYALGAVKAFDIIYAFLSKPSFSYFNFEADREQGVISFDAGFISNPGGDAVLSLKLSTRF